VRFLAWLYLYFAQFIRGLAGTVLVYKIAGALAQTGASLEEVYSVAEWVSKNIATVGVGLEHCHVTSHPSEFERINPASFARYLGLSRAKRI